MWNDIKNFLASINWMAILLATVAQWLFIFAVWGLFFSAILHWSVPSILRTLVDMGVFVVVYVWAARKFPMGRNYR